MLSVPFLVRQSPGEKGMETGEAWKIHGWGRQVPARERWILTADRVWCINNHFGSEEFTWTDLLRQNCFKSLRGLTVSCKPQAFLGRACNNGKVTKCHLEELKRSFPKEEKILWQVPTGLIPFYLFPKWSLLLLKRFKRIRVALDLSALSNA